MGFLTVDDPQYRQGKSISMTGPGSPTSWLLSRTTRNLAAHGLDIDWLGGVAANYNGEDVDIMRHLPRQTPVFYPKKTLPGLPYGFRGDPSLCEETRHLWISDLETWFKRMHTQSSSWGMVGGLNFQQVTDGGHLPMTYEINRLAQEHFSRALQVGLFWLPTEKRALWPNLYRYPRFPDDLGIPIIMANNCFKARIDEAVPTLIATAVAAKWITDRREYSLTEQLGQVTMRHKLLGLAEAHRDLPIIDIPIWDRFKNKIVGRQDGVASPEVTHRVADLIVAVLQEDAKLIHATEDPKEPSFIGIGGLPMPTTRDPQVRRQARMTFQQTVTDLVEDKLKQPLPEGLDIIWSSTVIELPDNYIRIPAVRVFPIPGRTAREYVDEMLADDVARQTARRVA